MFSHLIGLAPVVAASPLWGQYVTFLEHVLDFLAKSMHSAGLAVIVFTIVVKTALLPLTVTSIKSSKAMQELQPKIKELQKKHGKDRQRLSQETMKLYSQFSVNPMAGCLPMIIQIPIFFGVYRSILHLSQGNGPSGTSDFWQGSFAWLHSLNNADPYHILPILAGAFQFVQTKMMRPTGQGKASDPQQAMMNSMMNFMPLMVIVFGWGFASGPVIYWVTQSVYSVVQQWFITGWGSMRDWVPALPELPEHRRLGYRAPRDLDEVMVVSGEDAPQRTGVMGWLNKKVQEAQAVNAAPKAGAAADAPERVEKAASVAAKGERPVKRASPAAKAQRMQRANGSAGSAMQPNGAESRVNGRMSANGASAPTIPRKKRQPRRAEGDAAE
ncbi:MAG: YidC/Oxa1 family membrane protein insertase [Thermomicrobiales bacterium]